MQKLILGILMVVCLFSFSNTSWAEHAESGPNPKLFKRQALVLRCIRTIAEHRKGGRFGLKFAEDTADRLLRTDVPAEIEGLLNRCRRFVGAYPSSSLTRKELLQIYTRGIPFTELSKAQRFVARFLLSQVDCAGRGLGVFALVLGLEGKSYYCRSSNGRRWLTLGLQLEFGVGVLEVHGNKTTMKGERWNRRGVFMRTSNNRVGLSIWGPGENLHEDFGSMERNPNSLRHYDKQVMFGIPLLFAHSQNIQARLLPLFTNEMLLYQQLFGESDSGL